MKTIQHQIGSYAAAAVLLGAGAGWNALADFPSTVLSHNPLAYWQLNDATVSPAPFKLANSGSLGSIADAYAVSSLVSGVAGKVNNAAKFTNPTGTGHLGSRADVVYNPGIASKVFTVEFWVQPSAATVGTATSFDATGACPLSNFNPNYYGGARVGYLFYLAPTGKWNFRLGLSSGYAVNIVATTGLAQAGVWQHIAATYDGSVAKLYANGVLIGSANSLASVTGWVPNTGSFLRIGGTPLSGDNQPLTADGQTAPPYSQNSGTSNSGNRGFDGLIDEVAVYTNVLPATSIAAHYAAAATPATYGATILADGPTGYWNFDEPAITRPPASTFPIASNSGSLGSAADGTNMWGAVAAQPGPSYTGFPVGGTAVTLDGELGYVSVKDAPGLHFTGNITLSAWVKPAADDYIREIIAHGFDGNASETFLRIIRGYGYGDGYYYEVGTCDGELGEFYDSVLVPIPPGDIGQWVFLTGTFDGSHWNLYRNGVLGGTLPAYVSTVTPGYADTGAVDVTNTWTIGSRALPPEASGYNFAGSIAHAAIFPSALAAADIFALYNAAQVPPVITRAVANPGTVFNGSTVSLSVWAEGSPTLGYQWLLNGVPTGVTTTNYSIPNIAVGTFTVGVVVTNAYGTNSSSVTFTSVLAPPSIVTQPSPETRFVGYPFSLTVGAGGTAPLTYYWVFGGTVVQASASPTYSGIASLANAGSYSVIVSNVTGLNATSAPVVLTVNPVPAGYGSAVISSGPIAYWRLDETSGSTVAHDGIGGHDGVYNNTTLGVPGYSILDSDTAASFSGLNSYVGNISGTAINFTGHTNFTIEVWVKAPAGQADQASVIAKGIGNNGTTETEQFAIDISGGVYRFFTSVNGTLYSATANVGPNGTWQHIVAVYDDLKVLSAASRMYIYVNGTQVGSANTPAGGLNNTVSPVSIGSKRTGTDPNYDGTFNGTVDEVAIYAQALDSTTVYNHYAAAYGTTLKPFIAVQPTPLTNYATLPAVFSVSAAGSVPLTYQWKFNGADLPGATDSAFTNASLALTDAGTYSVAISNNLGGLVSSGAALTVLPLPTNAVTIPGLVAHLSFDNTLADATGRGNNGTGMHILPPATNIYAPNAGNQDFQYKTDGVVGPGALHYTTHAHNVTSTTSAADETYFVSLGVRPDLQFGSNVNFSVAFWIRLPLGYEGGDLPFFTDAVGSEGNQGFVFAPAYGYGTANPNPTTKPTNYGGWAYTIYDNAGVGVRVYGDIGSINDGNWHHLVYVIGRAGASSQVYLDGVLAHSMTDAGTYAGGAANINTTTPAVIGQDASGFYPEDGSMDIDDFGVWRRALAPIEAAALYVAGAPGLSTPGTGFSFVGTTNVPPISIAAVPGSPASVRLTWSYGTLQSATSVSGPYTDVPGILGSPYTVTNPTGNVFYRIRL